MRWTNVKPTEPGLYWVGVEMEGKVRSREMVSIEHGIYDGLAIVYDVGFEELATCEDTKRFAGPIPTPED